MIELTGPASSLGNVDSDHCSMSTLLSVSAITYVVRAEFRNTQWTTARGRSPPYVPSLRNAQPWFMCTSGTQCATYVDMAIFCFSYNGSLRALSGTSVTLSIIFFLPQAYVLAFFWITRPVPEPFRQCTNCSLRVDKSSVRFRKITALPPLSCHLHYALCSPSEI